MVTSIRVLLIPSWFSVYHDRYLTPLTSVLRSPSVDSRLRSEPRFRGAPPDLTSLLPPRYLSRADLERCSSVSISRYIISTPSWYSCKLRTPNLSSFPLLLLLRPTSDLHTLYSSLSTLGLDFRSPSTQSPLQVEGTNGVLGHWSITSPKPSPVSAELQTETPESRTLRGTVLTMTMTTSFSF